jgi:hypothetical protein
LLILLSVAKHWVAASVGDLRASRREADRASMEAEERRGRNMRFVGVLAILLLVAAGTVAQFARQPGAPALDTIWAEDGAIFLTDALRTGIGLLEPYAGYANVVGRLAGSLVALLPLDWAAEGFAFLSAFTMSLVAVYVFFASQGFLRSTLARGILAAAIPLLPAAGFDSLNNAATLHFALLFASFWAALPGERTLARTSVDVAVIVAATLSNPLALAFAPLAIWGWTKDRSVSSQVVLVAFLVSGLVQAWVVVQALFLDGQSLASHPVTTEGDGTLSSILKFPEIYGFFIVAPFLVGYRLIGERWVLSADAVALAGVVLLLIWLGYVVTRRRAHVRQRALISLAYSIVLLGAMVIARGWGGFDPQGESPSLDGNRYMVAPMLFLLTSTLVVLFPSGTASRGLVVARWTFVVLMVGLVSTHFSTPNPRSHGPRWSSGLTAAREACRAALTHKARVPITPRGWFVTAPCDRIL